MYKEIKYSNDATEATCKGIDKVANIIKTTVGPKGKNVLIREALSVPVITNDGATIAKNIHLRDKSEDAGAALVISAARKTNETAGDGTTTTTILTQAIINQYKIEQENSKEEFNPVQIQKDMIKASESVNKYLLEIATPAKDLESIKRVATISSGDTKIGELIAQGFEKAGEYGTVITEDSNTGIDYLDSIQGMKFNNGMITPALLNDRTTMKTVYQDAKVFVTTEHLDNIVSLMPILDTCIQQNLRLLILCSEMDVELLNTIILNKAQGLPLNVAVVRLPGYGQLKEELTRDICIATGATLITRDTGKTLQGTTINDLGDVKEVIVTQDYTILKFKEISETGVNLLENRYKLAEELKIRLKEAKDSDKEQYKRRISNLISGISTLKISGNSEVEIRDKKLRVEDAINSVESAREEGIVPGGGYSFILASENLKELENNIGGRILKEALLVPTYQIAENAGQDGYKIVEECIKQKLGYNALTDTFEDLIQTGIMNSVKTDRYSILNATSVASSVITMGGMVVDENDKDPYAPNF